MSTRKQTKQFLQNWVNTPNKPKFGVLLEGNWGVGKTHFVESILKDTKFTKKKVIYLSLFGINSIETLKTQLFFASANIAQKTVHRGASLASSLIKGTFRIDLNGDDKSDGSINANFKGLNKFVETISKDLSAALIVFDDLERCAIPMPEILGFANYFIEHEDTRIVFVANTNKMEPDKKEDFDGFKEKIIGHSLELKPQSDEALSSFIAEIDDEDIREMLSVLTSQIIALFDKSNYKNLRALRQFVWHYSELLKEMDEEYRKNDFLLQNLTEQFFVFFTEFKLDLGKNGLTPRDLSSGNGRDDDWTVFALHMNKDEKPSPKYRVLKKYSESFGGYDTVIPASAYKVILQSGLVHSKTLNFYLSESKYSQSSSVPAWRKLYLFQQYEDEAVEEAKNEIFQKFENREVTEIGEILHIFALRLLMSKYGIIKDSIGKVEQDCIAYVDELIELGTFPPRPTDWRWPESRIRHGSSHGYSFWVEDDYSESFETIFRYVIDGQVKAFENNAETIKVEILHALKTDPDVFAGLISYRAGEGKYASVPILHYIDIEVFIDAWFGLKKDNWDIIQDALTSRFEAGRLQDDGKLVKEKAWANQLCQALRGRAESTSGFQSLRISRIIPTL